MPNIEQKHNDQKESKIKSILLSLTILIPFITIIVIIKLYVECKINKEIDKCDFQNVFSWENFESFWPKLLLAVIAVCLFELIRGKSKEKQ